MIHGCDGGLWARCAKDKRSNIANIASLADKAARPQSPSRRVVVKIGAGFVGLVTPTLGMRFLVLRATTDFDLNAARESL